MIKEQKRFMQYTYFNRKPGSKFRTTHLFSFLKTKLRGMVCTPFPTIEIDLTMPDFFSVWSSSAKRKVNKALKEELAVDRGLFLLPDVLKLFGLTAQRKGLRGYRLKDFDSFPELEVSAIYHDDVIVCGHVWVIDHQEKRALLYVNASDHGEAQHEASFVGQAHYFLLWQDALFLQQKGIEVADLMGYDSASTDSALAGVYRWKAATHGKERMLYHYYPIWFFILRKFRNMLPR